MPFSSASTTTRKPSWSLILLTRADLVVAAMISTSSRSLGCSARKRRSDATAWGGAPGLSTSARNLSSCWKSVGPLAPSLVGAICLSFATIPPQTPLPAVVAVVAVGEQAGRDVSLDQLT